VAPDGSTNIPEPKVKSTSSKIGLEPILDWKCGQVRAGKRLDSVRRSKDRAERQGLKICGRNFLTISQARDIKVSFPSNRSS